MHFDLDAGQRELQSALTRFCHDLFPVAVARESGEKGLDRGLWRRLADMGVFALALPDSDGGAGLTVVEQVLAFEVLGAGLVPGPIVGSTLAAGLVEGASTGDVVVAAVTATDGPVLVPGLRDADWLLVLHDDRVELVEAAGIHGDLVSRPLDPTSPLTRLDAIPSGEVLLLGAASDALCRTASLLTSAALLGIARRTTELATDYAKTREQYGRTIGSFQAIKHMLADMLALAEVASASVHAAGVMLADTSAEAERAVAGARVLAGKAALHNAATNVQIHGGMGFTWELDAHLYLKRARLLSVSHGNVDAAAETVATQLRGALQ
ncbi:MAG: acyl-CoA dehydrogenase protein [Frankiales bacterium]|nr:acyl-CoA dehydrogenase protein [Frankiales bacterium]